MFSGGKVTVQPKWKIIGVETGASTCRIEVQHVDGQKDSVVYNDKYYCCDRPIEQHGHILEEEGVAWKGSGHYASAVYADRNLGAPTISIGGRIGLLPRIGRNDTSIVAGLRIALPGLIYANEMRSTAVGVYLPVGIFTYPKKGSSDGPSPLVVDIVPGLSLHQQLAVIDGGSLNSLIDKMSLSLVAGANYVLPYGATADVGLSASFSSFDGSPVLSISLSAQLLYHDDVFSVGPTLKIESGWPIE